MKTRALRQYGDGPRLEMFDLPEPREDEILARVVCASVTPPDGPQDGPVMLGRAFAGDVIHVGKTWRRDYAPGEKFALSHTGPFCGGAATYCVIPGDVIERGLPLRYGGTAFCDAALNEAASRSVGGYNRMYHTNALNRTHAMGIEPGGSVLILAERGPADLGVIEYPLALTLKPARVVVAYGDKGRLEWAKRLIPPAYAAEQGVELMYADPREDVGKERLMALTGGAGYNDVLLLPPAQELAELADSLLADDGCLNLMQEPGGPQPSIRLSRCPGHGAHLLGSGGGNPEDRAEALRLSAAGKLRPAAMVSHICGIDGYAEAGHADIPPGGVLCYTHLDMPLTAIEDFAALGRADPLFAELARSVAAHSGLWNGAAERILLDQYNIR